MKVNLVNRLISAMTSNSKTLSKIKKIYNKDADKYQEIIKNVNINIGTEEGLQLYSILLDNSEQQLFEIFKDLYPNIYKSVKDGIRFRNYMTNKNLRPSCVLDEFVVYKFFEYIMDSWQDPDYYENSLISLIYHNENRTHFKNSKPHFALLLGRSATTRDLINALCGCNELYAYMYDLFLHGGVPMELIEAVNISEKDYQDITMGLSELMQVNRNEQTIFKDNGRLVVDTKIAGDNVAQLYECTAIGVLIKVFCKLYKQKNKEIEDIKKDKEVKIVYREDENSKKIAEQKQQALNNLQLRFEKLQREKEKLEEELQQYKEHIELLQRLEEDREKNKGQQTTCNNKTIIPFGEGVVLYGGSANYQKRFHDRYPHVRIIDHKTQKIDKQLIKNAKFVLMNVGCMSHPMYWALKKALNECNMKHKIAYDYIGEEVL